MQPKISGFNETEQANLAKGLAAGRELCLALSGHHKGPPSADLLDQVFKKWAAQPTNSRMPAADVASGLGSLFGELLRVDFGFIWQMIEDQYGTEPALIDENTGSVIFPVNAVWKRIEPELDTAPFFRPMYESIARHLEKVRAGQGEG